MKRKIFVSISAGLLSLGFVFSSANFNNVAPNRPVIKEANHINNYDNYTYSGSYYNSISSSLTDGLDGTLRQALTDLTLPKGWYTYSGSSSGTLGLILQSADADPTNSSNMVLFYTRDSVIKQGSTDNGWNREHVWPQSLSNNHWGKTEAGADLLHIRPTYVTTNSARGNLLYGNVSSGSALTYGGVTYAHTNGSYFEPMDSVKGDVARILMYIWTAYHDYYNDSSLLVTKAIQSYDTLMTWHINDQPDELEGDRNDFSETSKQKNRNPFVDHPEYAWKIFGNKCSSEVLQQAEATYPDSGSGGGGESVSVTGISLNKTSLNLSVGGTAQLSATVSPSDATNKTVAWSSSNNSVATVSQDGLVTGVGVGETTITVTTADGGYTDVCSVVVSASFEAPTSSETEKTYIKGEDSPLFDLDTKGAPISVVKLNGFEIDESEYMYIENSFGLLKSRLDQLAVRDHTIEVVTEGGSVSWTLHIVENKTTPADIDGCSGSIETTGFLIGITAITLLGLLFIKRKQEN